MRWFVGRRVCNGTLVYFHHMMEAIHQPQKEEATVVFEGKSGAIGLSRGKKKLHSSSIMLQQQ